MNDIYTSFLIANQIKDGWYANITNTYKFKNKIELLKFIKKSGFKINEEISNINTIKAYNLCPAVSPNKDVGKKG